MWLESASLVPGDGYLGGFSHGVSVPYPVALDGETAWVGKPWADDDGAYSGSVYVFAGSDETTRRTSDGSTAREIQIDRSYSGLREQSAAHARRPLAG